jgi:hypothetical protein
MIKLFNKIRQQMLNENKTRRYLKYAFGEIILVVIGILIALQINNWNEHRKAQNEEQKILTALQSDFKVSKDRLTETMKSQQIVLDFSSILINIHESQDEKEFEYFDTHLDSLSNLIGYGASWYRAEPITGAYNALISAGKVDLIQNEDLRHLLAQFSADLESGFEDQESAMDLLTILTNQTSYFSLKIESNYFRKRFNLNPRVQDSLLISKKFFSLDSYFGNLYIKKTIEYNRMIRQQSMLNQIKAILQLIDTELSQ